MKNSVGCLIFPLFCLSHVSLVTSLEFFFFNYTSPHLLSYEELQQGIEQRKAYIRDYVIDDQTYEARSIPLYVNTGSSFNMSILYEDLEELVTEDIPDFLIINYLRIMFQTDVYDDILLPEIAKIPMWLKKGEKKAIHWTENHHILFTCAAYLLRQSYKEHFPDDYFDDGLDERLDWLLRVKQEYTLFEFNSPMYFKTSLRGFLILYDYAEDERIREAAKNCCYKILGDWLQHTNSAGVSAISSGRTYSARYYPEHEMYGKAYQELVHLLTGLGPFVKFCFPVERSTIDLILTKLDLVDIVKSVYSIEESFEIVEAGPRSEDIYYPLEGVDKTVIQLSMGGLVHPDNINNFYELLEEYDMFDHETLGGGGQTLKLLVFPFLRTMFSRAASSATTGSVLIADVAQYKNDGVMLSSCENYIAGYKGYQQMSGMAVILNTSVFTFASEESHYKDEEQMFSQTENNNQMPLMAQKSNVQVALYNPNLDLGLLGISNRDVRFYMEYELFDEVRTDGKWVFGRLVESYVAVHRHCVNNTEVHEYTMCKEKMQAWVTIVGNDIKYGDFETFIAQVQESSFTISQGNSCISLIGTIEGQFFDEIFCRNLGNAITALILFAVFLILSVAACVFCCKRCCCSHSILDEVQEVEQEKEWKSKTIVSL